MSLGAAVKRIRPSRVLTTSAPGLATAKIRYVT